MSPPNHGVDPVAHLSSLDIHNPPKPIIHNPSQDSLQNTPLQTLLTPSKLVLREIGPSNLQASEK